MNRFFFNVGRKNGEKKSTKSNNYFKIDNKGQLHSITLIATDEYKIIEITNSLNHKKACGYDDILLRSIK